MVSAIPASIKLTVTSYMTLGMQQVIDFFFECTRTHPARFINLFFFIHLCDLCVYKDVLKNTGSPFTCQFMSFYSGMNIIYCPRCNSS